MITGKKLPRKLRKKIALIEENGIVLEKTENTTEPNRQRAGIKVYYTSGELSKTIECSMKMYAYNPNKLFEQCLDFIINEIKFNS